MDGAVKMPDRLREIVFRTVGQLLGHVADLNLRNRCAATILEYLYEVSVSARDKQRDVTNKLKSRILQGFAAFLFVSFYNCL